MARKKVKNKVSSKKGTKLFLAEHKDRIYCGKCHYTEFKSRK
ncbi:30S ribosomal protein S27ae [Candidatus Woesearchaeota archaeon]|nr:30S ribosomal protein S27ae [Candidatus Woesearchaeota archaeon]